MKSDEALWGPRASDVAETIMGRTSLFNAGLVGTALGGALGCFDLGQHVIEQSKAVGNSSGHCRANLQRIVDAAKAVEHGGVRRDVLFFDKPAKGWRRRHIRRVSFNADFDIIDLRSERPSFREIGSDGT